MKALKSMLVRCVNSEQKVWYCKISLKQEVSNKRASCEFLTVVLVKIQVFWKITSFPLVKRYWYLKGACCCHILGLCSLTEAESGSSKTFKISVTVYQPTQNCINIHQLEKDVQSPWYISLKGWLRTIWAIMSCSLYLFIYKSKNFDHHTPWKCFHKFQTVSDLHFSWIWALQRSNLIY